jgi:REP element-mobilizing transposase RayT
MPFQAQLRLKGVKEFSWGGARKNAGRKPKGKHAGVAHGARPFHEGREPVLVTERFAPGLPSMRDPVLGKAIADCIRESRSRTFRVIHFSIQGDHLHLIVEAGSKASLARGMQGLNIRVAKRVNGALGRTGRVWLDRYHARALSSPREVRAGIRYVLSNWLKHVEGARGLDPYSSARWFDGWTVVAKAQETPCPVAAPKTWLAGRGWNRHGPIPPTEAPGKRADLLAVRSS